MYLYCTMLPAQPGPRAAACTGSIGDVDQGLSWPAQLLSVSGLFLIVDLHT